MISKPIFSTVILALLTTCTFAQEILLINGVPTKATVDSGNVTAVFEEVPNHMDGYEKETSDIFQRVAPRLGNNTDRPTQDVADATSDIIKNRAVTDIKVNSDYKFSYDGGVTTLSDSNKKVINQFANKIKSGEAESIQLSCTHKSLDANGKNLAEGRIKTIKEYLESLGIASNVILTTIVEGGNPEDHGMVSLLLKK